MKLEEHLDSCDAHMLKAAGVYAILDEDKNVMYIGQTESFIKRWGEHCTRYGTHHPVPINEVYQFVIIQYEDSRTKRIALESHYSFIYQPKYGSKRGGPYGLTTAEVNPYKVRTLNKYGRNASCKLEPYEAYLNETTESVLGNEFRTQLERSLSNDEIDDEL